MCQQRAGMRSERGRWEEGQRRVCPSSLILNVTGNSGNKSTITFQPHQRNCISFWSRKLGVKSEDFIIWSNASHFFLCWRKYFLVFGERWLPFYLVGYFGTALLWCTSPWYLPHLYRSQTPYFNPEPKIMPHLLDAAGRSLWMRHTEWNPTACGNLCCCVCRSVRLPSSSTIIVILRVTSETDSHRASVGHHSHSTHLLVIIDQVVFFINLPWTLLTNKSINSHSRKKSIFKLPTSPVSTGFCLLY